jgi:hypothetical protein
MTQPRCFSGSYILVTTNYKIVTYDKKYFWHLRIQADFAVLKCIDTVSSLNHFKL